LTNSDLLDILLEGVKLDQAGHTAAIGAIGWLRRGYGERRRRLGPAAVLHPLRAASVFLRAARNPTATDLLTAWLHDKLEDLTEAEFSEHRNAYPESESWRAIESSFVDLLESTGEPERILERIGWLTKRDGEAYSIYIDRLLAKARNDTTVIAIKLADRLDNTLDMRIAMHDPLRGADFYEHIFQVLFVRDYAGLPTALIPEPRSQMSPAKRLHQLHKNIVTLTLVGENEAASRDESCILLMDALATASILEAQRVCMPLFAVGVVGIEHQRRLLDEAMAYCRTEKIEMVTSRDESSMPHRLDGLMLDFDNRRLDRIERDPERMYQCAVAFMAVFLRFRSDPAHGIQGVTGEGVSPA
jgi:hypothetical protein